RFLVLCQLGAERELGDRLAHVGVQLQRQFTALLGLPDDGNKVWGKRTGFCIGQLAEVLDRLETSWWLVEVKKAGRALVDVGGSEKLRKGQLHFAVFGGLKLVHGNANSLRSRLKSEAG